jgi:methylated-DNA-[protein]-cysteine S-methyltransferase
MFSRLHDINVEATFLAFLLVLWFAWFLWLKAQKTGQRELTLFEEDVKLDLVRFAVLESSLGNIVLVSRNRRLIELDIRNDDRYKIGKSLLAAYPESVESPESFHKIRGLLDRYLKGERTEFDVDVDISHLPVFTKNVLEVVRKIAYGDVRSYGWISKRVGYSNAARAVGQAVGRNPVPIIIPCHRVIQSDGSLGGFSMGLHIKERLLALEGVLEKIKTGRGG